MSKLTYFDCNCSVGRVPYPILSDIPDAKGLIREMDTAGIEEALVYHTIARDSHPPLGNKLLIDEIKTSDRLHPVWVLLPQYTEEMAPPRQLLEELKLYKIKAVRIYPSKDYHSFSISDWCSGELLQCLEDARMPLMLDIEIVTWEAVQAILERYMQLPLIITNCSYRHDRFIYPLLGKYKSLHIETSRYMGAGAIEQVVKKFGAANILFGTNMPFYTGTAVISLLTYADISLRDKEAIAGGNLRNLLSEVKL